MVRLWNRVHREVVEQHFRKRWDVALGGVGFSGLGVTVAVLDGQLDMMLKVSSNHDDSLNPPF